MSRARAAHCGAWARRRRAVLRSPSAGTRGPQISTATSNARKSIQSHLETLEQADQEFSARVDKSVAEKLRTIADRIEHKAS
jgi:hypothetical protein